MAAVTIDQDAANPKASALLLVRFGLCCLMTPGPSEDIRCHV